MKSNPKQPKPQSALEPNINQNRAFKLSLIAAILILINAALLSATAAWFPWLLPTLPGTTGNDPNLLYTLSAVGLTLGTLVLLGAIGLRKSPNRGLGIFVAVASVPSVITGGGFIVGFVLGILGGAQTFLPKAPMQVPKRTIGFPIKMVDSTRRMKIEGAGPKIMAPLAATFVVTAGLSYFLQPMFNYPLSADWTFALGIAFMAVGIPFWLLSAAMFLKAWQQEKLATAGPFALMPNPIYGGFILFVIPGLSLLLNWWPILLTSVVMYAAQHMFIHEENEALQEKFGQQYTEYKRRVLLKFL